MTQIAAVSWEHPADLAALQSLRSIPGFDLVRRKISGFVGERGVRLMFQADAVRVGPKQFPRLNELYTDVLTTLDRDARPELFVAQTPFVNAGASGMERPFIVINSGTLKLLDDGEMRNLLGHELGHVMSGHSLYHTMADVFVYRTALTSTVLTEMRNVARSSYAATPDYASYASQNGLRFDLLVRSTTQMSGRLMQEVANGGINLNDPMTKTRITAGDLMAKLNADPEFVSKRAAQEADRQRRTNELRHAEELLVKDLRAAGHDVESIWDLVNRPGPYLTALPVLVNHLARPYPGPVREGIARALAIPEAKSAWHLLTRMFRNEQDERARDGLAVAIAAASDDDVVHDVITFARDPRYGPSRLLLLSALERSSDRRAHATLMELGTDPQLKKEIRFILRRLKAVAKQ